MKKVTIKINDKAFIVQSAQLGKLIKALNVLKAYPDKLKDLDVKDTEKSISVFIELLTTSEDEIFTLLSDLSGIDKENIALLDLADTISLVKALLEVNDIERIKKDSGEIALMFSQKSKK